LVWFLQAPLLYCLLIPSFQGFGRTFTDSILTIPVARHVASAPLPTLRQNGWYQRSMHAHTSDIIVNLILRIAKLCERIVYKEAKTRYSIGLIYLPRIAGGLG
ncbi:MAG: hypothetical protein Q8R24_05640, partial [Legionellaceae bacterium]|nr:hypothetical protein [Legionellaceae bacterium]